MARVLRRLFHPALILIVVTAALTGCGDDPSPGSNSAGERGTAGDGSAGAATFVREVPAYESPAVDAAAPRTPKVMSLVAAMTLEEKRQLIHGNVANPGVDTGFLGQAGYTPGIPRLGIPERRDVDALGIKVNLETTAPPTRIGLAATFDRIALNRLGYLEGQEGLARGVDVLYGPQIDLMRLPNWARNNTSLGEDPYLAGELAAMEISGVQGAGLMDNLKHFALYNGQPNQYSIVDNQVAHEIYLAPYEAAIAQAQPASVMCSYSQIQITPVQPTPTWACHNDHLLNVILRQQFDYKGLILSDYTAVHEANLADGLDQEFATDFFTAAWLDSVKTDAAVLAAIDRAVSYNLYALERFGYLNCADPDPAAVDSACVPGPTRPSMDAIAAPHQDEVRILAEKSAVLLKNEGSVLPIAAADLTGGVAVIGPTAQYSLVGPGGERSKGFAVRNRVGPLAALKELAPTANITYAPGIDWVGTFPEDGALTSADNAQNCLVRDDFDGTNTTAAVSCDATIDYATSAKPIAVGHKYTWTGKLAVATAGTYYLWVRLGGALPMFGVPASLSIDGVSQSLVTTPANANEYDDGLVSSGLSITLASGAHDIVLSVDNTGMKIPFPLPPRGPIFAQFRWSSYEATRQAAIDAAKTAKLVLVFANEAGGDSTGIAATATNILSSLDSNQDELIDAIAEVNPKTLVVLQNGQPVAMPWLANIPAVLETWYPGQEGGYATANILLGKVNPGAKLPVTFPAKVEDTPFSGLYAERIGGVPDSTFCGETQGCGKVTWSEGLLMGYRWYDENGIAPMFAFGEGLSYTTFAYSNVTAVAADGGIDVTFTVKNTGSVAGDAVPQVYLAGSAAVPEGIQYAKKSLVGFERVPLAAGQAKSVTIRIAPRQLSYWSSASESWVPVTGSRTVYVSTSSRDTDAVTVREVAMP